MKILISTFGVRGDVQPYLALAFRLQRAGHRVTLATSHSFTEWIEAYGVEHAPSALQHADGDANAGGASHRQEQELPASLTPHVALALIP